MLHRSLLFLMLLFPVAGAPLWAQAEMSTLDSKGPSFHWDAVNLAVPGQRHLSRLSLFLEVVYDELQFVKMEQDYEANYEASIIINDQDNDQVDGKTWQENISVANFDQTNKRTMYSQSNQVFDLEPGSYKLSIAVKDPETNLTRSIRKKIELRDYAKDKPALSDIIWISELQPDSSGAINSIRPQVSDAMKGLSAPAFAYFELYNPALVQPVAVEYEFFHDQDKKNYKKILTQNFTEAKTMAYFPIPVDSLNHGFYHLTVTANFGKEKVKVNKDFYVRWSGLPGNARDLDEAIEQTRFIAEKDELKKMKKAKGDQRMIEFVKFWQRRDPTPGTEINEALDAHYMRIEYANQHFSAMQHQGWRTDMGMVYIILGPPDDIERNAYPRYSKPYEIWYYYRYNRDFVFLDLTGFGDFRLETPLSIYEFQRLVD
jgi:GWxTD domain-containing protein